MLAPVVAHDLGDALSAVDEDVEPEQHRPDAVLLAHVVGAGAGALLAADGGQPGIEQVAEELPAGRRLVALDAELLGDAVGGGAGRHGAGDAGKPLGIARRQMGVGGEHGERIGRRDVLAAADDEVAVAVAVRRGAEIRRVRAHHHLEEVLGVDRVGIGVVAAEIGQRRAVDHGAGGGAERALEDRLGIGPGDRVHGVEAHGEAGGEQAADRIEIEQRLHQRLVVGDRIDHLDGHLLQLWRCRCGRCRGRAASDIRMRSIALVRAKMASVTFSGAGPPLAVLNLMPKSPFGPPGLWLAERMMPPAVAFLRMRLEAAGVESRPPRPTMTRAEPVAGGDLERALDGLAVEEAAVAADDQRLAGKAAIGIEDRLDEVLDVMRLLEMRHLLAQARGARLLVVIGGGCDRPDHGAFPSSRPR